LKNKNLSTKLIISDNITYEVAEKATGCLLNEKRRYVKLASPKEAKCMTYLC